MKVRVKMDKENNVYKDSNLEIRDNILKFNDHVIQLSNISSVSVSPMEKQKIPNELYMVVLIGLVCLAFMPPLGLIIVGAALFMIFKIISNNNSLGFYLKIELNSGANIYFNADDKNFLVKIVGVMENCFNDKNPSVFIDMKNSNIQYGDNNTVVK